MVVPYTQSITFSTLQFAPYTLGFICIIKKVRLSLLFLCISAASFAQNADINLLKELNVNRNTSLDPTFKIISNSVSPISIGMPFLIYSAGLIKKDISLKTTGINVGKAFLISAMVTTALKYSVNRNRPFVTYPYIQKSSSGGSSSFPSGHTSAAFSTATSLSIGFRKWYIIAPSFIWAGAVGYSRMDLGVHYPSDVLAGAIVGIGSAFLSHRLNKWIHKKSKHSK